MTTMSYQNGPTVPWPCVQFYSMGGVNTVTIPPNPSNWPYLMVDTVYSDAPYPQGVMRMCWRPGSDLFLSPDLAGDNVATDPSIMTAATLRVFGGAGCAMAVGWVPATYNTCTFNKTRGFTSNDIGDGS